MDNQKFIEIAYKKFETYLDWECNCHAKPFTDQIPILNHHRDCHMKVVQNFLNNVMWYNDWFEPDLKATIGTLKEAFKTDEAGVFKILKDFNYNA